MAKEHQKTVVITGCDMPNSYGYELALCLDKQGYSVFAGCTDCNSMGARSLASRGSTRLAILQIDVTKQDEIRDAVEMIADMVGDEGIWALVNCAESYTVAEVDWFSNDDYEQMMQVNYLGTVRVVKTMLPLLRKARGRIVNLSNLSGCVSRAGLSAFSASKFAVEAFSDSLRQEMIKWGIFVSVVQPAFLPDSKDILSDAETSVRLKRVTQDLKDVYGEDYFANYIRSMSGAAASSSEKANNLYDSSYSPGSPTSAMSSGYSTLTSNESSTWTKKNDEVKQKNKFSDSATTPKGPELTQTSLDKKNFSKNQKHASLTLRPQGGVNLSNMNRVLHALVNAVTASSPKVRYFVGSYHDYVIKIVSSMLPTVFVDSYFTSGEMAKVIPKKLKEKQD